MAQDNLSFLEKKQQLTRASLIGIPLDLGKDNIGTDAGPKKLRELGIVKSLTSAGVDVLYRGDVPAATADSAAEHRQLAGLDGIDAADINADGRVEF